MNSMAGDRFEAFSAGIEPGSLNALAVEVMREIGIDISQNRTKDMFEFIKQWTLFHYVVTVCDESDVGRCPVFPGYAKRVHWSFPDPAGLEGTYEEKLAKTREIRDAIKGRVEQWIDEIPASSN